MTTWIVTGCSTGLGRALAVAVLEAGHNCVVTARDVSSVQDLADTYLRQLSAQLDVTDRAQIDEVVTHTLARFGEISVLVNNAGFGYRGAVEEGVDAEVRVLFDTHFFGPVGLIKAVLPHMRARRSGTIVNVSSIGTRLMSAGSGYYSAAKAALEGLTGSLRKELEPLGIVAMAVEPGSFRTDFSGRSLTESTSIIADYAQTAGKRRKAADHTHGTQIGDPRKAASAIITVVESGRAPQLLVLGVDAMDQFEAESRVQLSEVEDWRAVSAATVFD